MNNVADERADRLAVTYRLCELLDTMMDVAPLRQNTLIVLAVSAELVPRLWYSALKVRVCPASCALHPLFQVRTCSQSIIPCLHMSIPGGLQSCTIWLVTRTGRT